LVQPEVVDDDGGRCSALAATSGALEVNGSAQAMRGRQHERSSTSGGQPAAALTAAAGQDGAPSAGTHPQAETVRLVALTVVGLERTLAHEEYSGVESRRRTIIHTQTCRQVER
jgi:hypothetical protein